jgi:hypothetical protein
MLRLLILLSIFSFLFACKENKGNPETIVIDSASIVNDPKNNLNIQTNTFSEIDSSGIIMFPLSMGESERADGGSLSYKSMPSNRYWNIIFLNSKSNQYHFLSDKKMLISNFDLQYSSDVNRNITQASKYIFYTIKVDDYNKDKIFDNEDPQYLFVSDKEGNNFRQISPANHDLSNWQFIKSVNKVLLTAKTDSDKNNKFDEQDEVKTFEVDMGSGTEAKELFSTDFKNKLKILYDKDWKRMKK